MKWTLLNAPLMLAVTSALFTVNAHSQADTQFSDVDQMIKRLESSSKVKNIAKSTKQEPVSQVKNYVEADPEVVDVSKLPKPQSFNESKRLVTTAIISSQEQTDIEEPVTLTDPNLKHKLSELPPYTRFEFNRNVFVPAYKQGVIFFDGAERSLGAEVDAKSSIFNYSKTQKGACALLSSKSYVMMRGANSGEGRPTYLEVSKVRFGQVKDNDIGSSAIFAEIDFSSKGAKNSASGAEVSITLSCVLPNSGNIKPENYTLDNLNQSVDNLFSFQLPQFIEI